ncbi:hypothetical protein PS691_03441 [Pseudomonas fluorescens]|uniref:Uncharacterized protein n=1 Tax=Pseudomonas fluorescens TaxID=294 RepID=A0A5E7D2C2_PSEFL|nr:hypothetical protein PS691_03441 [Pseudomonas fluorescens]
MPTASKYSSPTPVIAVQIPAINALPMASDTETSMVRWRVRRSRMAPLKNGAQL